MLAITTKDGKNIKVPQEIRQMSKLIDEALMDNSADDAEFNASDVMEKELNLVIEYCSHYNFAKKETDIEHPLPSKDPKVFIKD